VVIGVVGHLRHEGLDVDPRAQVYWSYRQRTQDRMVLVVRGSRDAGNLGPEIVAAIRAVDPEQPVYNVRTMTDVVQRSLAPRRLSLALVAAFAVAALLLASVGVYGVIAFGVAQRVREFGIRMALGAERGAVSRLVLREGATLAALGTLIGLAVALVLGGLVEGLLFGVQPRDALSTSAAALLLFGVAVVASYLPARRAAGVDPTVALRCD
jgi:ABC-type antimicrobial peptide transport system permease subunit